MMFINAMLYALFGICFYSSTINNAVDCLFCDITRGTSGDFVVGINTSCTQVLGSTSGLQTQYLWNTDEISCLNYSVVTDKVNGNVINVITGVITCGPFNTLLVSITNTYLDFSLGCLDEGGVTQVSGVGIGTIGIWPIVCNQTITYSPGLTNDPKPTNISATKVCNIAALFC